MKKWVVKAFTFWGLFWFVIVMTVLVPLLVLPVRLLKPRAGARWSALGMRLWARVFTFPIGSIWFSSSGAKAHAGPCIYIANHNSLLDTPAAILASAGAVRPLGKAELGRVPFFGWIYHHVAIMVDRKSANSRRASYSEMVRQLRQGISILIFPEGAMNKHGRGIQPFQDGAFRLAMETGVPIQPLVVFNTAPLLPAKGLALHIGHVRTLRLEPVYPKNFADETALKDYIASLYEPFFAAQLKHEPANH